MTRFDSDRHGAKAGADHAVQVVRDAADMSRDDARRMFKREAANSRRRFDQTDDSTARSFEAVFGSRMQAEAEARA